MKIAFFPLPLAGEGWGEGGQLGFPLVFGDDSGMITVAKIR
jgi:hypothetical protein